MSQEKENQFSPTELNRRRFLRGGILAGAVATVASPLAAMDAAGMGQGQGASFHPLALPGQGAAPTMAGTVRIQSAKASVVYDVETGGIRHIHQSVTMEGGRESTQEEMEAQALVQVSKRGLKTDILRVLHVPLQAIQPATRYMVDTNSMSLKVKE